MQQDIFEDIKPSEQLQGLRISLVGKFQIKKKDLESMLVSAGVQTSEKNKDKPLTSIVKETNLLVFGSDPTEDEFKRIALNEHHGYYAQRISENELYSLLKGSSNICLSREIIKKLDLTYDYYNWVPPVIKDQEFVALASSPLQYDYDTMTSSLALKEIYTPDFPGVKMDIFRQLIGNVGGYANREYFDDTNVVMLSDDTLEKLKQGIKDDVILGIEKRYNNSDTKIFNVQFTCQSEFLSWLKARIKQCNDNTTKRLLEQL